MCFRLFFFFKQRTAYEMRISDWSSDVCSSDLHEDFLGDGLGRLVAFPEDSFEPPVRIHQIDVAGMRHHVIAGRGFLLDPLVPGPERSEEHTSELQSLMRISYAVFSLTKNTHI